MADVKGDLTRRIDYTWCSQVKHSVMEGFYQKLWSSLPPLFFLVACPVIPFMDLFFVSLDI